MAIVEARLDCTSDAIHRFDGFDGVRAHRRLGGQHHGRRPVEDCVGHIGRLGTRRLRPLDHRLQHLRRRDRGLSAIECREDDPLLQKWHLGDAGLDPEISTGDHHRIGLVENVVERRHRLLQLDLRDDPGLRAGRLEPRAQRGDVGSRANERLRDIVDPQTERELEVREILVGEGRNGQLNSRDVHSFVLLDGATRHDLAERTAGFHLGNPQANSPVSDENVVARFEHRAEHRRGDWKIPVARRFLTCNHDLLACPVRRRTRRGHRS